MREQNKIADKTEYFSGRSLYVYVISRGKEATLKLTLHPYNSLKKSYEKKLWP